MTYQNLNPHGSTTHPSDRTRVPADIVFSHLTTAGTESMATDGSSSVVTFSYTVPAGRTASLSHLNIHIADGSVDPHQFGGLAEITNGCLVRVIGSDGTTILQGFDDEAINTNGDFGELCGANIIIATGMGDDTINARWNFIEGGSMVLQAGESFATEVRDDLGALTEFECLVVGVLDRSD